MRHCSRKTNTQKVYWDTTKNCWPSHKSLLPHLSDRHPHSSFLARAIQDHCQLLILIRCFKFPPYTYVFCSAQNDGDQLKYKHMQTCTHYHANVGLCPFPFFAFASRSLTQDRRRAFSSFSCLTDSFSARCSFIIRVGWMIESCSRDLPRPCTSLWHGTPWIQTYYILFVTV